jgi:GNAT superfamily N-acetyltransferase
VSIEVRRIDPADEALVRDWWTVTKAARAERALDPTQPFETELAGLRVPSPNGDSVALGAFSGPDLVGTAKVWLPRVDNTHMLWGGVQVPPEQRRQGVGSALLAAVEELGRDQDRRTFMFDVATRTGEENDGTRFAARHGYTVANLEQTKGIDLPEWAPQWGPFDDEVAARIGDYRIEVAHGRIPEEYAESYCAAVNRFVGLIPLGELELEELDWTVERLRQEEQRQGEVGADQIDALAIAPDGTVAGFSNLEVFLADPSRAHVGITMVLPPHRGHALGLGLKLASHRALIAAHPSCALVVTGNANANEHMNAINERLGYRVLEQSLEMQKKL